MCGSQYSQAIQQGGNNDGVEYTQLGGGLNAFLVPQKATEGTEGLGGLCNAGLHLSSWAAVAGNRHLPRSKRDGFIQVVVMCHLEGQPLSWFYCS